MERWATRRRYHRRAQDGWVALAGLLVFVPCALVARSGRVGPAERAAFRALNKLPDWLSGPMTAMQYLGTLVIAPLVALVALVFRRWRLAAAAGVLTILKLAAERVVKMFVHRQRPGVTVPGAILRGNVPPRGFAFVSGHLVLTGARWPSS
jgi:membrane-associated phospholipid phosphatase